MFKVKAINYAIAKKITHENQVETLIRTSFKKNKIGLNPKVVVPAELFEKRFDYVCLPENLTVIVQGQINKAMRLIGKAKSKVKASVLNKNISIIGNLKLSAKRAKSDVIANNKSKVRINKIYGNLHLAHDSKASVNNLKGDLIAHENAQAYIGNISGKVETSGNAGVVAGHLKKDADSYGKSSVVFWTASPKSKFNAYNESIIASPTQVRNRFSL